MQKNIVSKGLIVGIIVLFIGASVVSSTGVILKGKDIIFIVDEINTKDENNLYNMDRGARSIVWDVQMNFTEPMGSQDWVIFGEATDAFDGPQPDCYDIPKPPASLPPYVKSWFNDSLPTPYDFLFGDYRMYPDTDKMWDLYVRWESSNSDPTNITISWNSTEFDDCEYGSIDLMIYDPFTEEWDFAAHMITEEEYVYSPRYFTLDWMTEHFRITAVMDILPPEITGIPVTTSDPKDTDAPYGWENFSCTVTDDTMVDTVQLNLTYPDLHTEHIPMNKDGDTYYYNTSLTAPGGENTLGYNYHIYATDTFGRMNTSTTQLFKLPMNADVNEDGSVGFVDIMSVAGEWGQTNPKNGWIRADVNNDGEVGFVDIMCVAGMWGQEW